MDKVQHVSGGFGFVEGATSDFMGNVFFTDQPTDRILKWSVDGLVTTFMQPSGRANGMCFDRWSNLWACADERNELRRIDVNGNISIVVYEYDGKLLNGPNDVWVSATGGVFFTDPFYLRSYWDRRVMEQDGQHVYYLSADYENLTRVVDDLQTPNGIIGTPDGAQLYLADVGTQRVFRYDIQADGRLSNRTLFCSQGSDGMTLDAEGNVYLTGEAVSIYAPSGKLLERIEVPNHSWIGNVAFGGSDLQTLIIAASTDLYSIRLGVAGIPGQ